MNPLSFLTSALGGIWGYVAAGVVSAAIAAAGMGYVVHKVDDDAYKALQLSHAQAETKAVRTAAEIQHQQDAAAESDAIREAVAQQKLSDQSNAINREVTKYVPSNRGCITVGLVRVLDAAALGVDPADLALAAGQSDDACTTLTDADLAASVAANYGIARQNAEQLNALEADVVTLNAADVPSTK